MSCNIFIEKEPGYNCEHPTYSNSKQSRFLIDTMSDCTKMLFLLFLNFLNLSEKLHSDKCKDIKSELEYISVKDSQLIFPCLECKKNYNKDCNKELIKRFANTYGFFNRDINRFVLLFSRCLSI